MARRCRGERRDRVGRHQRWPRHVRPSRARAAGARASAARSRGDGAHARAGARCSRAGGAIGATSHRRRHDAVRWAGAGLRGRLLHARRTDRRVPRARVESGRHLRRGRRARWRRAVRRTPVRERARAAGLLFPVPAVDRSGAATVRDRELAERRRRHAARQLAGRDDYAGRRSCTSGSVACAQAPRSATCCRNYHPRRRRPSC